MSSNDTPDRQRDMSLLDDYCCPTCGALQDAAGHSEPTSDRCCRRCGSDLQLVYSLAAKNQGLRQQCLVFLKQRRLLHATRIAKQCLEISASEPNSQLLATCYLLSGDFVNAGRCLRQGDPEA